MDENNLKPNNLNEKTEVLHTYLSDMADAVRENEASVIKIALAEQKKRENEELYREVKKASGVKIGLIIGAIILIVGGIVLSYLIIREKNKPIEKTSQSTKIETIIPYENQAIIDITGTEGKEDALNLIKGNISIGEKTGTIKAIFLKEKVNEIESLITTKRFFGLVNPTVTSLIRSLKDQYMIGTYTTDTPHLFLIFQTKDYGLTYAGMLNWEKTMLDDLHAFFNIDISGNRKTLSDKPWADLIIDNKDSRVLRDDENKDLLYYTFINKDTLVITDDKSVIKNITGRMIIKNNK